MLLSYDGKNLGVGLRKLSNQELAITNEIRKYKQNYLHREIAGQAMEPFVRFSKELVLLLSSHCKNIIFVAPQKLSGVLDQLGQLFDDMLAKHYQLFLKYNDKFGGQLIKVEPRTPISDLCAVCSQQIKKVQIDKVRRHILNEADLHHTSQSQEIPTNSNQQDLQFFAQVNDLLTRRQGQLLKNQIEINHFHEEALAALNSLLALKDFFSKESLPPPNTGWLSQAKQQMQSHLKEAFNSKIPPWISKMFALAWALRYKQRMEHQVDAQVQTSNSTQSQVLELKKKIMLSKDKLQKSQQRLQTNQHEMVSIAGQKKQLQLRVDYYRKQLNKLIEEIQNIKAENHAIRMKLSSKFPDPVQSDKQSTTLDIHQSRDVILNGTARSARKKVIIPSGDKLLPKINKGSPEEKSYRQKRDSQTSIKLLSMSQSHHRSERKSSMRPQKISGLSLLSNHMQDSIISANKQNTERVEKIDFKDAFSLKGSIIQEEQLEPNLQEDKKKIQEVSAQLKQNLRNKQGSGKHFYSTNLTLAQVKDGLKRIPRKTNKISQLDPMEDMSAYSKKPSPIKQPNTNSQNVVSSTLSTIYHFLKNQGYLMKLSEDDFKHSIIRIKAVDMNVLGSEQFKKYVQVQTNKGVGSWRRRNERLSQDKNNWSQQTFHIEKDDKKNELAFRQTLHKEYFGLFQNQNNAYNYQCSLTKNHKKGAHRISKEQQRICQEYYGAVNTIKQNNPDHYKFICCYLRYPFQIIQNDFGVVNLVNQMSFQNFQEYFQRILSIHHNCPFGKQGVCQHIQQVRQKLINNASRIGFDKINQQ